MQDLEELPSDPEGRQRLVGQRTDPLLNGRHHAAVDERLLQVLSEGKESGVRLLLYNQRSPLVVRRENAALTHEAQTSIQPEEPLTS